MPPQPETSYRDRDRPRLRLDLRKVRSEDVWLLGAGEAHIISPMTDREIALELGTRLILAKLRVESMAIELDLVRDAGGFPLPSQTGVDEVVNQVLVPVSQDRIKGLHRALDAAVPGDLLRSLQTFLEELSQ
jgi:hypothetical protein